MRIAAGRRLVCGMGGEDQGGRVGSSVRGGLGACVTRGVCEFGALLVVRCCSVSFGVRYVVRCVVRGYIYSRCKGGWGRQIDEEGSI